MSSESELKTLLLEWVVKKNPKVNLNDIDAETQLLERRIISSVQIMDLLLYIEYLSGESIKADRIKPGVFSSVNTIYKSFFADNEDALTNKKDTEDNSLCA